MMIRLQIRLDQETFRLLRKSADREYRDPRSQAAYLIAQSLHDLAKGEGLNLSENQIPNQQAHSEAESHAG